MGGSFSNVRDAEEAIAMVEEEVKQKTLFQDLAPQDAEIIASLLDLANNNLIPKLYGAEEIRNINHQRDKVRLLLATYAEQERKVIKEISAKYKAESELAESLGQPQPPVPARQQQPFYWNGDNDEFTNPPEPAPPALQIHPPRIRVRPVRG
jgi:hypothetical protein